MENQQILNNFYIIIPSLSVFGHCAYDACGNYAQGFAVSNDVRDIRVTGIKLSKTSLQLTKKGSQYVLKAMVLPANASNKSVVWKSNNVRVAKVPSQEKLLQ